MKGIILAGGSGTRLRPLTDFVCKQLLPVYDKPLIYYPLTSLILAGIKEILIISTPRDTPIIARSLKDGSQYGISLSYAIQEQPKGLADAFILGRNFVGKEDVCMILGDNILFKSKFTNFIKTAHESNKGATIFGFPVQDPKRFGVVEMDLESKEVLTLEEKPLKPKSNLAAIGLYIYDNSVLEKAENLQPSCRGEIEITDLNNLYLNEGILSCYNLSRGDVWIDAGVFDAFSDASQLIRLVETRLGLKIGSPEEASYNVGNITASKLEKISEDYSSSSYGEYLLKVAKGW